jgi:tetratricopeptide (TPR) repeat protein
MKLPEESIKSFTSAIRAAPLVSDSYLGRGNVYASLGNIIQARRDYSRALHLDPSCSEASVNIAYLMQLEKRYKKAWDIFNGVLAVNPRCVAGLDGRAIVHYHLGNFYSALIDIAKAIEYDSSNPELHTNRGVIYQALGDRSSALHSYKV